MHTPARSTLLAAAATAVGLYAASRFLPTSFDWAGKVVLLTGGSRGLGLAMARELVRAGAHVALLARDPAELAHAADDLATRGVGIVLPIVCDMCDEEAVRQSVIHVAEQFGRLDVVINNAGTITVGPLATMTRVDWQEAMLLHFWAPLWCIEAALPLLRRSPAPRIVNISSFGGKIAVPHMAPYCASKFALVGLSDALRAELAAEGIRVTTVCPGLLRTGSHRQAYFKGRHAEEFAWFSSGAGTPVQSMEASRAARRILHSAARGQASLVITLPARLAVVAQALAPNLVAAAVALANRTLPQLPEEPFLARRQGWDAQPASEAGLLTRRADAVTERYGQSAG